MTTESKRLSRRADAAQRAQRGWALRVAGASWEEIAEVLGYTHRSNAIRAVRAYFGSLPTPDHEEMKLLWRQRHELLWRQSQDAIRKGQPGSLRAGVAIARSASQLDGLDAPRELTFRDPDVAEFDRTVREMVRLQRLERGELVEGDPFAEDILEVEVVDEN